MSLDTMLEHVPSMSAAESGAYRTIDTYAQGTVGLYSSGPVFKPTPINPQLAGNVRLDLKKSTPNTYVLKQQIPRLDESIARYIHHDKGPGRTD